MTATQAANRFPNAFGSSRHTIGGSHPNFTVGAPERASNFLSWADGVAYADWSGLRPMTELEFEKICRGAGQPVVAGEFPWGSTAIHNNPYTLANDGDADESITNLGSSVGNASYSFTDGSINGPLRVGIFCRDQAKPGASFYGVMEMSGNLSEKSVIFYYTVGRAFTGIHGDGALTFSGSANPASWPSLVGAGLRGGAWPDLSQFLSVSNRSRVVNNDPDRKVGEGFRCVRSEP